MANFFAVVDPDPARRTACIARADRLLDVLPGLRRGQCASGDFAAVWTACELAFVSTATDARGAGALWGEALDADGTSADAMVVRSAWRDAGHRPPAPRAWDGFYAAVAYESERRLVAGADLLGLFPVYYWSAGDVLLVGSTISAFRAHSSFRRELNPVGLTGILLTGGLVDGESILKGVHRLSPRRVLIWSPGSGAREVRQYAIPTQDTFADRPFDEHVTMLDQALDRALTKHGADHSGICLLLSGGRDSRVVGGLLHRRGLTAHALTLGERRDYDVRCAGAVAKALRFAHTVAPDPVSDFESMARRHVQCEQLANGMANFYTWGMVPLLPACGARVFSGYWMEDFIGGTGRELPGGPATQADPFERVLRKVTSYGVGSERLRRLAPGRAFGDAVAVCVERMRAWFGEEKTDPDRRAWQFDIDHRGRYHAGSTAWRMSLGAWPTFLPLDRELMSLCASFPKSTLLGRRAEDALLRRRFPALARLPLDRNSNITDPLAPSAGWRLLHFATQHVPLADRARLLLLSFRGERRRYYRLYDINSPMWRAVRRMAEDGRKCAAQVLDPKELNALLPPPDVPIDVRDPITDSNGLKAVLGFLIWCSEHA